MRKHLYILAAACMALVSCQEWEPVFTGTYAEPEDHTPVNLDAEVGDMTIAKLKALYTSAPVTITDDLVIKGQVISSDESGNIYRTMYIQDATGAIEVKMGKSQLYNDYKPGQWVYVRCKDLVLGQYGGRLQLGLPDPTGKYETAYIDVQALIDQHVLRGALATLPAPVVITEAQVKDAAYYGMYVTVTDLTYGNQVFCILYDKNDNGTYLRNKDNYGVTTWAITKEGFKRYMDRDRFGGAVSDPSAFEATPYTLSQYFKKGSTDLQVRTSGYAKFADVEIASDIRNGAKVTMTGLLTYYNGNNQFTLIDLDGVKIQ